MKPDYNMTQIEIGHYLISRYDNDGYEDVFYYNGELMIATQQKDFGENGSYYFDGGDFIEFDETGMQIL